MNNHHCPDNDLCLPPPCPPSEITTDDVKYVGADDVCTGVVRNMWLTEVLNKITTFLKTRVFGIVSQSLVVTYPEFTCDKTARVEIVPSTNAGNIFILGTDGYPFVPPASTTSFDFCSTFTNNVQQNNTVVPTTYQFLGLNSTACGKIKITAPTGFAVTGFSRTSAFGKMEWFSTLTLANNSAQPNETVLIYNDTTENLIAKNGVHYQGIGVHKIGKLTALLYTGSISNLIINMEGAIIEIFANSSKITLLNVEVVTNTSSISVIGTSVIIGGLFNVVGKTNIGDTSELINATINGLVFLAENSLLYECKVKDTSPDTFDAAVRIQGQNANIHPTISNCYITSQHNQGIFSIYSTCIINTYAKSFCGTNPREGIYIHGGNSNVNNKIICTNSTGESLTGQGIHVVSNLGLSFVPDSLIDWQVSNCTGISKSGPGIGLIEGNIRNCTGYSIDSYGIFLGGAENPSSNVKVIECIGESRKSHGLFIARGVFVFGGTFISRSNNSITGSPIALSDANLRTDNYSIVGVNTVSVNTTAYAILKHSTSAFPVKARISGCNFTNPYLVTNVPGIDPAIVLNAVTIDAYGNIT